MRTTLTLDPDVAQLLKAEAHRRHTTFKQVVNEAIRQGLSSGARPSQSVYRVRPHQTRLQPGIDSGSLNRLVDELEDEAVQIKIRDGQ